MVDKLIHYLECKQFGASKEFLILLICTFLLYYFDMAHLMLGNHDFSNLAKGVDLFPVHAYNGLFGVHFYRVFLSYGEILPVVPNLVAYSFMIGSAFILAKLIRLEGKSVYCIVCALLIVTSPVFLSIFYYKHVLVSYFCALFLVSYGVYLTTDRRVCSNLLGSLCIFLGLQGYAASLSMVFVLASLWLFHLNMHWKGDLASLKTLGLSFGRMLLFVMLGICSFMLAQKASVFFGFTPSSAYHLNHFSLMQIIQNAPPTIINAFKHFWITQPFLPAEYKWPMLVLLVSGFGVGLYESAKSVHSWEMRLLKIATGVFLFASAIIFCKTAALINPISRMETLELRFAAFNMPYIYAFALAILFSSTKYVRIAALTLAIFCISVASFNTLYAQRIWKIGYEKEMAMYTRIVERIVTSDNYDQNTKYVYLQAGLKNFRVEAYKTKYDVGARELLGYPLSTHWLPAQILHYVEPSLSIKKTFDSQGWSGHGKGVEASLEIRKKYKAHLDKMKPWPHKDSVLVIDDVIFVALDPGSLARYQDITR